MQVTSIQKILIPFMSMIAALGILAFQHIENSVEIVKVAPQEHPLVIEYFTSQSCELCTSADLVANTVKDYKNVIVLSYHVDYWNRLGWTDIFSDSRHSNYQRQYEKVFDRNAYTPQMVINGKVQFDGSNVRILNEYLKRKSKAEQLLAPEILRKDNEVEISYDLTTDKDYDAAYALLIMDEFEVDVFKGPNKGKKLINSNVVIDRVKLNLDNTNGLYSFKLSPKVTKDQKFKVALLLKDDQMKVVGAAISETL